MNALTTIKKILSDTAVIAFSGVVFLIVLALVIQTIVGGAAYLLGFTDAVYEPFTIGLALILFSWIACIVGSISGASDVKKGGAVIAKRLGAVQATARTGQNDEKALIKVVADTVQAYGCALPSVHVLREEASINSMVLGSLSGDTAIVFTKGALRNLKEQELSALAAHEFAHIANDDVARNMKLMVAFGGLLALHQYGSLLVHKEYSSLFLAPVKLLGYGLIGFGFVGVGFAYLLRTLFSRRSEIAADSKAVSILKRSRALCSALSKIKQSPDCDKALHAPYVEEVRHLCFHAGSGSFWRNRFNSSHPSIDARLRKIDPKAAVSYMSDAELGGASLGQSSVLASGSTSATDINYSKISEPSAASPEVSKAANDAARTLGILGDEASPALVGDKLSMSVQDPVSSLAAVFSLFMPDDKDARPEYLSALAFAYNQNFADSVAHLNEIISREIHVERLSVAKHVTAQLKTKLAPDASRRVLLNIERLLKAQGLHNLMSYSAVQYLRHELAADFPVLNRTADKNTPDAEGRLLVPSDKMGEEFSRLISLVLHSTDLDRETADNEYDRVMASYADADYPRCDDEELADVSETEAAFQLLLMQPRAIRETFVQHCKDIFDLDKEDALPKRSQLELLCAALGCSGLFGERWGDEGYGKKVA